MGNCLKNSRQSKTASTPAPETDSRKRRRRENKFKKVHFDAHVEVFGIKYNQEEEEAEESKDNKAGIKEQVRIRITKKQLEELLGKVELKSLSLHEMMSCLVKEHLTDLKDGDCRNPLEPHNPSCVYDCEQQDVSVSALDRS